MKILTIIGARPQFIKAAAMSQAIRELNLQGAQIEEKLIHTGQHYDSGMSDIFFDELEIPAPAYHLGIGSASHGTQTGRMMEAMDDIFLKEKPDWVLVYGDTNSTLAGALCAAKLHIPVAHIEAGLRSFNKKMPEEVNRVLTDHVSTILFVPTQAGIDNLKGEGTQGPHVQRVGDVMMDVALYFKEKAVSNSSILTDLNLSGQDFALTTVHRAENTDDPDRLRNIVEFLCRVAKNDMPVVLPLHPRTQKYLTEYNLIDQIKNNLHTVDPVGYMDMAALLSSCSAVLTDSGGVQKEAYFHSKPCLTLRDETEWVELVHMNWNRLAPPTNVDDMYTQFQTARTTQGDTTQTPYGNGNAAKDILNSMISYSQEKV